MSRNYWVSESLQHHGVKGMKWGVRRYQNEDGGLTRAGKVRYSIKKGINTIKEIPDKRKDHLTSVYKKKGYAEKEARRRAEARYFKEVKLIKAAAITVAVACLHKPLLNAGKKFIAKHVTTQRTIVKKHMAMDFMSPSSLSLANQLTRGN